MKVADLLSGFASLCDTGFVIAVHVRFTRPLVLFRTYPRAWCDYYDLNGLVMHDPVVRWSFCNTGAIRWDDSALSDPADVIGRAKAHGVANGVSISVGEVTSRTLGGFSRAQGPFSDDEILVLRERLETLHLVAEDLGGESDPEVQALRAMPFARG